MVINHTSEEPLQQAGKELTKLLEKHKNSKTLVLLAGGSALQALEYVDTQYINEYTTVMMMDERFSENESVNNYLQMTHTSFYTKIENSGAQFIQTIPQPDETHDGFSKRVAEILSGYITENPTSSNIALFGIGPDGHTAGIFPMDNTEFDDTYNQGDLYVPVTYTKNPFSKRCSITPKFITTHLNHTLVYAVGEDKRSVLTSLNNTQELYEFPAHIHKRICSHVYTDLTV